MSITLNLNQARELLDFFGGEDAQITVGRCGPAAHSGPGLYAWLAEHPEEGSVKLDEEPQPQDDDGVPADAGPSFDVEAMLRECVPAGSFFGSLKVADAIRAYFAALGAKIREGQP